MDYTNDPAYQKAIQKLLSLPPHVMAVINPSKIDPVFASREMQKQIMLKRLGEQKRFGKQRISLGENRLKLLKDEQDFAKKQRKYANILAAIGIPISGAAGLMNLERQRRMAAMLRPRTTAPVVNALPPPAAENWFYNKTDPGTIFPEEWPTRRR